MTWWQQVPAFADSHRVVTLDLRAYDRPAWPWATTEYMVRAAPNGMPTSKAAASIASAAHTAAAAAGLGSSRSGRRPALTSGELGDGLVAQYRRVPVRAGTAQALSHDEASAARATGRRLSTIQTATRQRASRRPGIKPGRYPTKAEVNRTGIPEGSELARNIAETARGCRKTPPYAEITTGRH